MSLRHSVAIERARERYGVATISRLLKIIGLFCRMSSLLWGSFAKKTHNFKDPTHRSHPISTERARESACACACVCACDVRVRHRKRDTHRGEKERKKTGPRRHAIFEGEMT